MNFNEMLQASPAIAILRGIRPDEMLEVCEILRQEGIRLLEVPLNSPDALTSIRLAAEKYHVTDELLIGAGTVLTPEAVRQVAQAGGKFIISPNTDVEVIRTTRELGLISIPGFITPSEAFAALRAGADYLKLFPAGNFGVGVENLTEFLKVCPGAGIGSALYKPGKSHSEIRQTARKLSETAHMFQ